MTTLLIRSATYLMLLSGWALPMTAQTDTLRRTWEFSGTLSYVYSNETWSDTYYPPSDEFFWRQHTISLRPSVGYFVSEQWEVIIEPQYSLDYWETNLVSRPEGEGSVSEWTHNIGLRFGVAFNYSASNTVILFVAMKVGSEWTYVGADPPYTRRGSLWSKAAISLPVVTGGTKIFFVSNWAVIIQTEYSRTTDYSGFDGRTRSAIGLGMGVSVFL